MAGRIGVQKDSGQLHQRRSLTQYLKCHKTCNHRDPQAVQQERVRPLSFRTPSYGRNPAEETAQGYVRECFFYLKKLSKLDEREVGTWNTRLGGIHRTISLNMYHAKVFISYGEGSCLGTFSWENVIYGDDFVYRSLFYLQP